MSGGPRHAPTLQEKREGQQRLKGSPETSRHRKARPQEERYKAGEAPAIEEGAILQKVRGSKATAAGFEDWINGRYVTSTANKEGAIPAKLANNCGKEPQR